MGQGHILQNYPLFFKILVQRWNEKMLTRSVDVIFVNFVVQYFLNKRLCSNEDVEMLDCWGLVETRQQKFLHTTG